MKKNQKNNQQKAKRNKATYYYAVGRRKEATAQVRLYVVANKDVRVGNIVLKKGDIVVNNKSIEDYFRNAVYEKYYFEPLRTTNNLERFAISIKLKGGGLSGQLGAIIHGISRALLKVNEDKYRSILKKRGFLTRDARVKERRKAGLAHKARAEKQSPKR